MMFDTEVADQSVSGVAVASLVAVDRIYEASSGSVYALRNVTIELPRAQFTALVGESGSGKSTLLNILSGVDRATAGEVDVAGTDVTRLSSSGSAKWRSLNCGVILQSQQLIPSLTAGENVRLAMDLSGSVARRERTGRSDELLGLVGLGSLTDRFPDELSGGQQQRVAVARALANDPALIVADEPTAALDSATAADIYDLLAELVRERHTSIVCSTHSEKLAVQADSVVRLHDGEIA